MYLTLFVTFLFSLGTSQHQHHWKSKVKTISQSDFNRLFLNSFQSRSKLHCASECGKRNAITTLFDHEGGHCACHTRCAGADEKSTGRKVFVFTEERGKSSLVTFFSILVKLWSIYWIILIVLRLERLFQNFHDFTPTFDYHQH